jgi:acetyltransferase-like isoleucine patch superfamily enzyme
VTADELRELAAELARGMRDRWDRDLPLDELVSDRWERARTLGFGEGASIYASSYVYGDVRVGRNTWIGPFTILEGTSGITIGESCSISAGVHVYTHDSIRWALSGGAAAYEHGPVTIGDHCYIGPQTVVSRGVVIGDRCLVGACSLVNEDIPSGSIALGVPARVRGRVEVDGADVKLFFE